MALLTHAQMADRLSLPESYNAYLGYINLGMKYFHEHKYERSISYLLLAFNYFHKTKNADPDHICLAASLLAKVYLKVGNVGEASRYLNLGLEFIEKCSEILKSKILILKGEVLIRLDENQLAYGYLGRAEQILQRYSEHLNLEKGYEERNLFEIKSNEGESPLCADFWEEEGDISSIKQGLTFKNSRSTARSIAVDIVKINLKQAQILKRSEKYARALNCLDISLFYIKREEDDSVDSGMCAIIYFEIGSALFLQGDYANAAKYLNKALWKFLDLRDEVRIFHVRSFLGCSLFYMKNWDEAVFNFKECIACADAERFTVATDEYLSINLMYGIGLLMNGFVEKSAEYLNFVCERILGADNISSDEAEKIKSIFAKVGIESLSQTKEFSSLPSLVKDKIKAVLNLAYELGIGFEQEGSNFEGMYGGVHR